MSTYIGFNLNGNRQIEHFQAIEKYYGPNSDCGKFFFKQAELALKGSYIPKEEVYCMPYEGPFQAGDIERFIKDAIRDGALAYQTHFPLRDIAFVYERTSSSDSRRIDDIQKMLQKTKDNPQLKRQLNAYRAFHREKEKETYNRVITAIGTNQGVLLFNDTGRGIQYAQKYLQHIGDNFFSPAYKDADKLQMHYFSTSNENLVKEAQKCSDQFEHGPNKVFIPTKARFLDSSIAANYPPATEYSMAPTLECYDQLVKSLNLQGNGKNHNIGILDRICRTGKIGNLEDDYKFNHQNSFTSLDERIRQSYVGRQDGTLLKDSLERTIKDTAKRILQTEYSVRGYEAPQQAAKKTNRKGLKLQ